ncbi:MAG TPA: enoyl-CoA hydratase/isomerase family protein [Candidatus Caldiarchaeum subterraneum]|uniref:Enoyl-CoA hydratase/isomerase family protein n=1 Tax=Caldiarchaeum subterraneum TaxID=311458 RepID=A0A833A587_CALS0|nr:enoyl-CoA hydratase/isomerase family protein [Candidatus Caldarchaeum subterraneum]
MSAGFKTVKVEQRGNVAYLTISRPPLNIINLEMINEITQALDGLATKQELNVLVVRSGLDNIFSAGADVREHLPDTAEELINRFGEMLERLIYFPRPTVCVVDGRCMGGGMELAMACDFIIASERAELGQPEIKVGVYPPIAAALLPRLVGLRQAARIILTGGMLEAWEAYRIGLVNEVAKPEELEGRLEKLLNQLTNNSGAVMLYGKKALLEGLELPLKKALAKASEIYLKELMQTEDAVEGLRAFLDKRRPQWRNK